jgi:UDPglucose 6-dehydrogenase
MSTQDLDITSVNLNENSMVTICGHGYVGSAMSSLCEKNDIEFNVCDTQLKQGNFNHFYNISNAIEFVEKKHETHFIFICVPTPSDIHGNCDTSIVKSVLSQIQESSGQGKETYVIIKSTLVPQTTQTFTEYFPNLNIILFPEFLTEKNYLSDVYNAKFALLGVSDNFAKEKYQKVENLIKELYKHNKDIDIIHKSYTECELFRYTLNTYFATKITFFNEINELCEKMNVDYQNLKSMFHLDSRVGSYGIEVPGPGNDFYGFSLGCLPKETRGMRQLQEKLNLSSELMTYIDKRNKYFNNKQIKK